MVIRRGAAVTVLRLAACGALAAALAGCGDGSGQPEARDDRLRGGALGGGARVETLARTRLRERPRGEVAWVADEIRLEPGEEIEHTHELAFAYSRAGEGLLRSPAGEQAFSEGEGVSVEPGVQHAHAAAEDGSVIWEIRLAAPASPAPRGTEGGRRVFASEPLEGIPDAAAVSFLAVTVSPSGGRTSVHTHPGPEFIYQLAGQIDYQNAIVGTKRLGPGGAEAIPPDTAVQKRNPYKRPATFLSWFLVDPDQPFAPRASF